MAFLMESGVDTAAKDEVSGGGRRGGRGGGNGWRGGRGRRGAGRAARAGMGEGRVREAGPRSNNAPGGGGGGFGATALFSPNGTFPAKRTTPRSLEISHFLERDFCGVVATDACESENFSN